MRWHEALFHLESTARTLLRGEVRRDSQDGHAIQPTRGADPGQEEAPTGKRRYSLPGDAASPDWPSSVLQRLRGSRALTSALAVFTAQSFRRLRTSLLPFGNSLASLLAILGPFVLLRDAPMQAFQSRLCLAQEAWVLSVLGITNRWRKR